MRWLRFLLPWKWTLDDLERLFMPWTWNQRKRLTPEIREFDKRMLRFRERNGEPVPVDRGHALFASVLVLAICYCSLMTAGSGCVASRCENPAAKGHHASVASLRVYVHEKESR